MNCLIIFSSDCAGDGVMYPSQIWKSVKYFWEPKRFLLKNFGKPRDTVRLKIHNFLHKGF